MEDDNFEDGLIDGNSFSLLRREAIEHMKMGEHNSEISVPADQWFNTAIAIHFSIAARKHGYEVLLSSSRTDESRVYWTRDMSGVKVDGDTPPDHFKHAGFLCFWLRRRIVLDEIIDTGRAGVSTSSKTFFANYGSELCAFLAGYWLCLGFEYSAEMDAAEDIEALLSKLEVSPNYLTEVCKLMRYKEVSPHALYLIYKSLFTKLGKGDRYFELHK